MALLSDTVRAAGRYVSDDVDDDPGGDVNGR